MSHYLYVGLFAVLMLPGIVGVILPILPGLVYMFVIAVIFGFIDRFIHLTTNELAILGVIAVMSLIIDYISGILGAKLGGASKQALIYGFAGMIAGLILLPPFGGVVGLFVGVLWAEFKNHKNQTKALKAATGSVLGVVSGMAINILLALLFLICFGIFGLK